jgi:hypothetical protein
MIGKITVVTLMCVLAGAALHAQAIPQRGESLVAVCGRLPVEDACDLIAEASTMLHASYATPKKTAGVAAFQALGYDATYVPAQGGWIQNRNNVFLVSKPASNRLFIVITGTETIRDALQDVKFRPYTTPYKDGQFYVPPGHAGFHRGAMSIINSGVLRIKEFDQAPLDCAHPVDRPSLLALHLCQYKVGSGTGPIDAVLVGHSLGAGIAIMSATAVAGLEVKRPDPEGVATIEAQQFWPLRLQAVIGFAPPYAVYIKSDREAGMKVPEGIDDQWKILNRFGLSDRTILFLNERDIVPALSFGYGRHFGHRFRVQVDGTVTYDGMVWGKDASMIEAHSSLGYCSDVLTALGRPLACQ